MKLLNEIKEHLKLNSFNLEFEAEMVQTRILSTFLEIIESKGLKQKELEGLTGLKQPFISALFNNKKKLNVEHIALFQEALKVILQPPAYLSKEEHVSKFYIDTDYCFKDDIYSSKNLISKIEIENFSIYEDEDGFVQDKVEINHKTQIQTNMQYAY